MFTTIIVKPIFNLLVLIYALLPGHNLGLAIIIFTIIVRLLLWPLLKKQLHQAKAMRALQPEIKRVKQEAKGDRQKESRLLMELYKERGINPVGSIGVLIPQFIVLIGLYSGLRRVVDDPHAIIDFAYPILQHLGWMQHVAHNIHAFDQTLFGVVDLTRAATGKAGIYWPAMVLVLASAIMQYYQSKQLMPSDKNARSLRQILASAGEGKQADQAEVSAAVGRSTRYLLPVMIFLVTVNLPAALGLYWLVGGIVAFIQQDRVLKRDESEMEAIADRGSPNQSGEANDSAKGKPGKDVAAIPEAEIVTQGPRSKKQETSKRHKSSKKAKRRKKR
ncbi:MAG TPA: YidC/Oxa1 family membrane protein insertase [Candidatus Saccharimonadales bacterium]|jgi:YidC/Oxa1 family membrane protein insertase|nr:YidC/Oxa1 family membrane protein insertase [Candidatus Saccharimonadales bacterium]